MVTVAIGSKFTTPRGRRRRIKTFPPPRHCARVYRVYRDDDAASVFYGRIRDVHPVPACRGALMAGPKINADGRFAYGRRGRIEFDFNVVVVFLTNTI